jgi:aryl-alcohol dehydrogenase-like predicted oxidoreductase
MDIPSTRIQLGASDIEVSPLGIGAWAWGDKFFWGYGRYYNENDIQEAFEASIKAGINFFDTAESYARGLSERILGELIHTHKQPLVIATKFMPYPWRLTSRSLFSALRNSLNRLHLDKIDLYQVHWPLPPISIETWVNAIADCVDKDLVKAIGVSNYSLSQTKKALSILVKRDMLLASNQVEFNLLNRKIEYNGLLAACKDLGISIIAYSPLAQGLLSGKYSSTNPPPGARGLRINRGYLEKIQHLIRIMREIGQDHDGKTPSQVALNWIIRKGAIPIPGVKNRKQAIENTAALGWSMSDVELQLLDRESERVQRE